MHDTLIIIIFIYFNFLAHSADFSASRMYVSVFHLPPPLPPGTCLIGFKSCIRFGTTTSSLSTSFIFLSSNSRFPRRKRIRNDEQFLSRVRVVLGYCTLIQLCQLSLFSLLITPHPSHRLQELTPACPSKISRRHRGQNTKPTILRVLEGLSNYPITVWSRRHDQSEALKAFKRSRQQKIMDFH